MSDIKRGGARRRGGSNLGRKSKNTFVTKSGQTIKVNQSLTNRIKAYRDSRTQSKARRLAGMPKGRIQRFFYRLEPKRLYHYWFSREGGIMALKVTGIGLIAGFLLLVGVFAYFRKDLPNLKDVSGNNVGGSIRYYDRTGQTLLWEDYDAVKRIPVKGEEIAQTVKDATVAIEDKDFFKHGGFDVRGIARAGLNNFLNRTGDTQGGSTITQQLVKLTQNWSEQRTYTRKVKELILSVELERSYSKQDILVGYLNTAPYGSVDMGVEAVTRDMLHKSAKDLTLDESAMLAAIPKSPSIYSPYGPNFSKEALIGRQHYVLDLMEQQGMITGKQRDEAKKVDTIAKVQPRKPKYEGIKYPYFVLTAKEQLEVKYGDSNVKRGGWKVITTLDTKLQDIAEQQVQKGHRQVKNQGGDEIAFAAEDVKTGQMVALVGGTDFFAQNDWHEINYARQLLPPGSSFKPYDYAALIEHTNNAGAGSVLYDTQGVIPGYPCTNKAHPKQGGNCLWDYDFRFPGPMTIRYALGGSRNIPAVKAMLLVGVDKTINTAKKLMTSPGNVPGALPEEGRGNYSCFADEKLSQSSPCYASSAIGDGAFLKLDEHVHGYASLSRSGTNIPQTYILKIEDAGGKTVDEWKQPKGTQAMRSDAAFIVADILSDPNASYFSKKPHRQSNSQGTWKFGMKTGTTNDGKDGWMMGFSTQYAAGVWVGYHNRQKVLSGFMESMTQPIWEGWMDAAHADLKPEDRVKPNSVQSLPAFVVRSHVGLGSVEPSPSNDLFPSWYTGSKRATGKKQVIDIISNKLATDCTPSRAKKEVFETDANTFSVDTFAGQGGSNTTQTDDIHQCSDAKPSISLSVNSIGGNQFQLIANVGQGTHALSSDQHKGTVNFIIDGQIIQSFSVDSPGSVSYNYTADFSGTKTVTAEIIDSVLYDASDSSSITSTGGGGGGGGPLTITAPTEGQDVGGGGTTTTSLIWSGGSPNFTVTLSSGPAQPQCNGSARSCTLILPAGTGNYTVTITDGSGNVTSRNFKK